MAVSSLPADSTRPRMLGQSLRHGRRVLDRLVHMDGSQETRYRRRWRLTGHFTGNVSVSGAACERYYNTTGGAMQ